MKVMDQATTQPQPAQGCEMGGPRVVSTPGTCGGKPRIAGHRITVKHIVLDHQRGGMSPDEIASAYQGLTLADVYAALAYYFDNREAIDVDIRAGDEHWEKVQAESPGSLIDRLRQRKADVANNPLPPR
jgi:uncharacterized protein (DUF433 family)